MTCTILDGLSLELRLPLHLVPQGKTSTILGLLSQLPKDYRVVLLKNEYGDVEGEEIRGSSDITRGPLLTISSAIVQWTRCSLNRALSQASRRS